MRVMIDTNIIISATLFPQSRAALAMLKAINPPFCPMTSDYVINELHRKFREKFPKRITELNTFLYSVSPILCIVQTPKEPQKEEENIRDINDRPILRAALTSQADMLLTGDKDFLDTKVKGLRIISVSDFIALS